MKATLGLGLRAARELSLSSSIRPPLTRNDSKHAFLGIPHTISTRLLHVCRNLLNICKSLHSFQGVWFLVSIFQFQNMFLCDIIDFHSENGCLQRYIRSIFGRYAIFRDGFRFTGSLREVGKIMKSLKSLRSWKR